MSRNCGARNPRPTPGSLRQDNQAALAQVAAPSLAAGLGLEDVAPWPRRIEAVARDDVKEKAALWLDLRRSVTGFLLPAGSYPASRQARTISSSRSESFLRAIPQNTVFG
jgi:hypothetical protein